MKNRILILAGTFALAAVSAFAGLPTYKSTSASGTTAATAYFPADPNSQVRVVGYNATSDKSASVMSFTTGTTAYSVTITNAATSSVTNYINTTNGLANSAVLVLQHAGTDYQNTISSYSTNVNGSFVVLASGGWGVSTSVGDDVYLMSAATTVPCGATTSIQNGEAVYVGNYGRPVAAKLDGTSACAINAISAHYDGQ
jgi:hypothetical protein